MKMLLTILSLLLAGTTQIQAQTPGTLDTSFGGDGTVRLIGSTFPDGIGAQRGAIQSDGKIVFIGVPFRTVGGGWFTPRSIIARLLSNGDRDTSFGEDGVSTTEGDGRGRFSIAIQTDGKYIGGGQGLVTRYLPDGSIDATHIVSDSRVNVILIQPDGKIVLLIGGGDGFMKIVRLDPDFTLDSSFGTDGEVLIPVGVVLACTSGFLQPDGKIVVAGYTVTAGFIARVNLDGSLDAGFGEGGTITEGRFINDLALLPDGKIVALSLEGDSIRAVIRKYLANGEPDTCFASDGVPSPETPYFHPARLVVQPDGKILAAGAFGIGTPSGDVTVARYLENGTLDTTFGEAGYSTLDFDFNTMIVDLFLQSDGKIILAGGWRSEHQMSITRLHGDPPPPADLSISLTSSRRSGRINYTIVVTNNGPGTAHGVTVVNTLPEAVTWVSSRVSLRGSDRLEIPGSCSGTSVVTCTIESLASGVSRRINIFGTYSPQVNATLTDIVTTSGRETDPVPDNNTATMTTTIRVR